VIVGSEDCHDSAGERSQIPVALDEFQDGDVIRIGVAHMAPSAKGRYRYQRNTRTVAEEVERLDVTRVVVAAFVHRDEKSGAGKKLGIGAQMIHDLLDHALEQIHLR